MPNTSSVRAHKPVSDAQFRRDVAKRIHTTDGVWAPSTKGMKKVDGNKLPEKLKAIYKRLDKTIGDADVFTTKVDGRSVYLFEAFDTDLGGQLTDLRDASGRSLKIGDQPHEKLPLPHSEEPAVPVSRETWLKDLKDAMRYPVQAHDTPIIKGKDIPPGVQKVVDNMMAKKDSDGFKTYQSVEVHHVRIDGRDSYLVYGNAFDGVSEEMFDKAGHKLDVMF